MTTMKEIYRLKDTYYKYDIKKRRLYEYWGDLTPEIFREANLAIPPLLIEFPAVQIVSITSSDSMVRVKDIDWLIDYIMPQVVPQVKDIAFVLSHDQMAEQSVRVFRNKAGGIINIDVFEFEKDAVIWLDSIL